MDGVKTKIGTFQNRVQFGLAKLATRWRISKVAISAIFYSNFGSPDFVFWLARLGWGSKGGEVTGKEVMLSKFENPSHPKGCFDPFCKNLKYEAGPLVVNI